jgi:hypothetical protein
MDGRQTVIAGLHRTSALGFDVGKERPHQLGRHVFDLEAVDAVVRSGSNEGKQLGQSVAIA